VKGNENPRFFCRLTTNYRADPSRAKLGYSCYLFKPRMNAEQANYLAIEHFRAGRLDQAQAVLRESLARHPDHFLSMDSLAVVLSRLGRFDESAGLLESAIRLNPVPVAQQYRSLGEVYRQLRRIDESIKCFERAIALKPDLSDAHISLGVALLTAGKYERGWEEMEWRWVHPGYDSQRSPHAQPIWNGTDPAGKTILIYPEQGMGDVIQFARYAPLLARRGAKVIIGCQAPLNRVMQTAPQVHAVSSQATDTPPFDLQIPSSSLPRAFGTTLATIPRNIPYLFVDPSISGHWRQRLAGDSAKLKVGIVWAGSSGNTDDAQRSLTIQSLAPLEELRDVSWYSLQKGDRAADLAAAPAGLKLRPLGDELHNFADTAGLLANLDLLIAPDTAPLHLAGAMGRPAWALLRYAADWRWLSDRDDSPWYPSMRLFRQSRQGDWTSVVQSVTQQLKMLITSSARPMV
jgi:Tfp pilus assembly protein PilF